MAQVSRLALLAALTGAACTVRTGVEDPDAWFDPGEDVDVREPVTFTDIPYDFPARDEDGIRALKEAVFPAPSGVGADVLVFGPDDAARSTRGCNVQANDALPFEIEGIVTAHPRFYFKTSGCDWSSDEKFYGSFFIQDATGGLMVLGDTKVAHFDMGDRVRIRVRGVKTSFDLDMAYTYDLLEIVDRGEPIYYEEPDGPFACPRDTPIDWDACDVSKVMRVTGTVVQEKDTFGDFVIESDEGVEYHIGLDVELNRRGVDYKLGERITATGPILFSYDTYTLVVMRVGQIDVHD